MLTSTSVVQAPEADDRSASCSSAADGLEAPGAHSASMPHASMPAPASKMSPSAEARSAALSTSRTCTLSGICQKSEPGASVSVVNGAAAAICGLPVRVAGQRCLV